MIPTADYVEFLGREYLDTYLGQGGAAVKFVVPADDDEAGACSRAIAQRARAAGFVTARVDAADIRVHMVDQVFFEVARQIDWDTLAREAVQGALSAAAYPSPGEELAVEDALGDRVAVETVARHHAVDPLELTRDVNRALQQRVYHDYAMVQEFRITMLRLCQAQLRTGQVTDAEHAALLDWLKGDLRQIAMLRSARIFRRIGRHNARQVLFSLAHWLSVNNRAGLVLELDLRRLGFARRPRLEERNGIYYTKATLLDTYELLRQLVDNTDELSHCCVVALVAPEFLSDTHRGVDAYQALKLRIYDEVRDRHRDNPYSSLIRVGSA